MQSCMDFTATNNLWPKTFSASPDLCISPGVIGCRGHRTSRAAASCIRVPRADRFPQTEVAKRCGQETGDQCWPHGRTPGLDFSCIATEWAWKSLMARQGCDLPRRLARNGRTRNATGQTGHRQRVGQRRDEVQTGEDAETEAHAKLTYAYITRQLIGRGAQESATRATACYASHRGPLQPSDALTSGGTFDEQLSGHGLVS